MKATNHHFLSILAISALTWVGIAASSFGADLSSTDKQFLEGYEKIRASLAADDLASAKQAASAMGEAGGGIATSRSLKEARSTFATLSNKAEQLVAGQTGYYVLHCSMVNKDWVQTSPKVGNPYAGKEMLGCGEIKTHP